MADGFLGRWSQRKRAARQGAVAEQQIGSVIAPQPLKPPLTGRELPPDAASGTVAAASASGLPLAGKAEPTLPLPTLQDVADLTADSDYSAFVARAVAPQVRNAAMKKLFADPHFNVMDGLDTYIDDYSIPDPLPQAMLRKMASAKFMQLFDDKVETPRPDSNTSHTRQIPHCDDAAAASPPATSTDADPPPPRA